MRKFFFSRFVGIAIFLLSLGGVANLSSPSAAHAQTPNTPPRTAIQSTYPTVPWFELGGGVAMTGSQDTGNFFGPGTGSGVSLTNNGWSPSFIFSAGAFMPFTPGWYGGIVVNVITPSSTVTIDGVTSNGIPVSSHIEQSGVAVDVIGRAGVSTNLLFPFVTNQLGFDTGIFLEGGVEFARYNGTTLAPTVGDSFSGSTNTVAPIIGGGVDAGLCTLNFYSAGRPTVQTPSTACPHLVIEVTHTFTNQNWTLATTPLSSGADSEHGVTRTTVELEFPFIAK
jgi:hypothetical protein